METWVTWTPKGYDPWGYNPRKATRAHLAEIGVANPGDVRVGMFPLACGRWAPDGLDAEVVEDRYARRCQRCEAIARKRR